MICLEVVYATPALQRVIPLTIASPVTIQKVIEASGIIEEFTELKLDSLVVGVWGKTKSLDSLVSEGDRIEIYRPLTLSPMEARRRRAAITRKQSKT